MNTQTIELKPTAQGYINMLTLISESSTKKADREWAKHELMKINGSQSAKVETIKKGEFVKRKADAKKTYRLAGYCRINRAYQLDDEDDISRAIYVKKGTVLFIGFDY